MTDLHIHMRSRLRLVKASAAGSTRSAPLLRPLYPTDWLLIFCAAFVGILIPHLPLLTLPYFWDEAGYYIPAARDLLLTGSLIPHSTLSSGHPPLVMAYLAGWWKLAGFSPLVTRVAMLVIAAAALTGVFRIAQLVANRDVAIASTILTALFPVFFAQSTLAHLDMAAAALTLWALAFYIEDRRWRAAAMFSLAALAKETAILAPFALFCWELICQLLERRSGGDKRWCVVPRNRITQSLFLLLPVAPLVAWFVAHWAATGRAFGSAEFFQYNVSATVSPVRFLFALVGRTWHVTGYMNMYVLTAATVLAMFFPALRERSRRTSTKPLREPSGVVDLGDELRQRIAIPTQLAFLTIIAAYVVALSIVGGALLVRYLLPVIPLWIIICVSTLRRRIRLWVPAVGIVCLAFAIALLINPPYRFAPEDNLAYRDFVELHRDAAQFLESKFRGAAVLTAWPASDEITHPFLGYVQAPFTASITRNFSAEEITRAAERNDWNIALIFSIKYEPPGGSPLDWLGFWRRAHERYFDYHRDLPLDDAARALHGRVLWSEHRGAEWIAVLQRD